MSIATLQDDLLEEYKHERRLISSQLEIFDPLGVSLRKPAAQRLLNKGVLIFLEIVCYLLFLGSIAFAIFMDKLYPFNIFNILRYQNDYKQSIGAANIEYLYWSVIGLVALISFLFFVLSRIVRKVRLKNNILHLAASHIKTLVGQHLQRKAAIEAIDQRHFSELPDMTIDGTSKIKVNDVLNPGYESR